MAITFFNLNTDVVIVAGPNTGCWPSVGVKTLSKAFSEQGIETVCIGGDLLSCKGITPLPDSGGIVFAQDQQKRIYRIVSKFIICFLKSDEKPVSDFDGMESKGFIEGQVARRLFGFGSFDFNNPIAVLGTENKAFQFAIDLLEKGCPEVFMIQESAHLSNKTYEAWEVYRRRFDILGGKWLTGEIVSLKQKYTNLWEFRIKDNRGVRVLEVGRVVSFRQKIQDKNVNELESAQQIYSIEQRAAESIFHDPESWEKELYDSVQLSTKVIKVFKEKVSFTKFEVNELMLDIKKRIYFFKKHQETPLKLEYKAKWLSEQSLQKIKEFSGTPKGEQKNRPIASLECIEPIACNLCEKACPTQAIVWKRGLESEAHTVLNESLCISCGKCLQVCPTSTPILVHEFENRFQSKIQFSWRMSEKIFLNENVQLMSRAGVVLGVSRVLRVIQDEFEPRKDLVYFAEQRVEVEVPNHLLTEVRGIRKIKNSSISPELIQSESKKFSDKVEVFLEGERRFIKPGILLTQALFELGRERSSDLNFCNDGSCGGCYLNVDGIKQLACKTETRKGMNVDFLDTKAQRIKNNVEFGIEGEYPFPWVDWKLDVTDF